MTTEKHYTSHHMLHAAFCFRKAELWKTLNDHNIFAVTLPSGEIGYCIVMGALETYYGLGLYRGKAGFSTYLRMIDQAENETDTLTMRLTFDVINCNFSQANEMNFNLKEPVREFSKKFNLPIPKKKGWPEFVRYKPFRELAPVDNMADGDDIATALFAGVYLAKLLKKQSPEELGFKNDDTYPTEKGGMKVPLLVDDGFQKFHIEETTLPPLVDFNYPQPKFTDKALIKQLSALPKKGSIEIGTLALPIYMEENPENIAPFILPMIDKENGAMAAVACLKPYDEQPEDLLNQFADFIASQTTAPKSVICTDELTEELLRDFCFKAGIQLIYAEKSEEYLQAAFYLRMSTEMGF